MDLLRRRWIVTTAVALATVVFAPLAVAMAACDIACLGSPLHGHEVAQHIGAEKNLPTKVPVDTAMHHAQSCYGASLPLMAGIGAGAFMPLGGRDWRPITPVFHRSLTWPPPKHRPRG